jgi:hypothetical protein
MLWFAFRVEVHCACLRHVSCGQNTGFIMVKQMGFKGLIRIISTANKKNLKSQKEAIVNKRTNEVRSCKYTRWCPYKHIRVLKETSKLCQLKDSHRNSIKISVNKILNNNKVMTLCSEVQVLMRGHNHTDGRTYPAQEMFAFYFVKNAQ